MGESLPIDELRRWRRRIVSVQAIFDMGNSRWVVLLLWFSNSICMDAEKHSMAVLLSASPTLPIDWIRLAEHTF